MTDFIWKLLFVVGFVSCFLLVIWIDLSPDTRCQIESAIRKYSGTIVSLGTVLLILFVGILTTVLANQYAERREVMNRRISAALALSGYRQEWINSLRDDLASFSGNASGVLAVDDGEPGGASEQEFILASKILLRMNPRDKHYEALAESLRKVSKAKRENPSQVMIEIFDLRKISQRILKDEWDRLKQDLENAQVQPEVIN